MGEGRLAEVFGGGEVRKVLGVERLDGLVNGKLLGDGVDDFEGAHREGPDEGKEQTGTALTGEGGDGEKVEREREVGDDGHAGGHEVVDGLPMGDEGRKGLASGGGEFAEGHEEVKTRLEPGGKENEGEGEFLKGGHAGGLGGAGMGVGPSALSVRNEYYRVSSGTLPPTGEQARLAGSSMQSANPAKVEDPLPKRVFCVLLWSNATTPEASPWDGRRGGGRGGGRRSGRRQGRC